MIGDKLVVVFRLQDGLNVICLFVSRCFVAISFHAIFDAKKSHQNISRNSMFESKSLFGDYREMGYVWAAI